MLEPVYVTSSPPTRVLLYVHGTWAPRAEWTSSSSALTDTLIACSDGLHIYRFIWSGGNSLRAREEAANCLRQALRLLVADHPAAQHFVVAHSHGGNVVFYALRDLELQARIAGIACLSTPFLHLQRRRMNDPGALSMSLLTLTPLIALGVALFEIHAPWLLRLIAFGVGMAICRWLCRSVVARWSERAEDALERYELPLLTIPCLIVRLTSDEAALGLSTATLLSWTIGKLVVFANSSMRMITLLGVFPIYIISRVVLELRGLARILVACVLFPIFGLLGAALMLLGLCLEYVAAGVTLPFLLTAGLFLRAYTPWLSLSTHYIEVSAEPIPRGAWQLVLLPARSDIPRSGGYPPGRQFKLNAPDTRFAHAIYQHPQLAELLTDWIANTPVMAAQGIPRAKYVWSRERSVMFSPFVD